MRPLTWWLGLTLSAGAMLALAEQDQPASTNKLLSAKMIYVAPMPDNIDQWMIEDLRVWAKYKRTANPEGVDLYVKGDFPDQSPEIVLRQGIPRPRPPKPGKSPQAGERCPRLKPSESPLATINVINWVTGDRLWYVHLLNKKPKMEEPDIPNGPHTDIYARGLTPDQIAMKITTKLRAYVSDLERDQRTPQH